MLAVSGPHWVCPCSQCVCFPGLHCSGSRLLCWGTVEGGPWVACPSQIYATQIQVLGYSTKAQIQLGLHSMPFPGLSNSGNQVLGEHTVPGELCILVTSLAPAVWFTRFFRPQEHHLRCALCLLWGADTRLRPSWQISTIQYPRKTW